MKEEIIIAGFGGQGVLSMEVREFFPWEKSWHIPA